MMQAIIQVHKSIVWMDQLELCKELDGLRYDESNQW